MEAVNNELCGLALDHVEPFPFERFVCAFHADLVGANFVPLGGVHDGGADGFEERIFENETNASSFLQVSKAADFEEKIRKTIKRLQEFGRKPTVVTFYFSTPIPYVDQVEEKFLQTLGVAVRVRGKSYIVAHINNSVATRAAFHTYLEPAVAFLRSFGAHEREPKYPFDARALCTFLGQEVDRRRGQQTLLASLVDTLVLWALEGTDPQKNLALSRSEILQKIVGAIPSVRKIVPGVLDARLLQLSSKGSPTGRPVTALKKLGKYALRFEERERLTAEALADAAIRGAVSDEFKSDFFLRLPSTLHSKADAAVSACFSVIETIFSEHGFEISQFALDRDENIPFEINASKFVDDQIDKIGLESAQRSMVRSWMVAALRGAIYNSTAPQRDYLQKLGRTYFLLFMLRNDPKVVEYFNSMAANCKLYVGSDLLIRAISELYLPETQQHTINALAVIRAAGGSLVLTQRALEEVFTHIRATILEFENYYMPTEGFFVSNKAEAIQIVSGIPQILIRSYFYARRGLNLGRPAPKGWRSYIHQFADYAATRSGTQWSALLTYLASKFQLDYQSDPEFLRDLDPEFIEAISAEIKRTRSTAKRGADRRAENDAVHIARILADRQMLQKQIIANPFGHRVWWLTQERAVKRAIHAMYSDPPRVIMRPEFLLHYIAFSPKVSEVRNSFNSIFPTTLGLRLGYRIPKMELRNILRQARLAGEVDEHRAQAIISDYANRLSDDMLRVYPINMRGDDISEAIEEDEEIIEMES